MIQYELKVFDDGEYAVRKLTNTPKLPIHVVISSKEELQHHLTTFLYTRWPINEVMDAIENAQDSEWTEFK